MSTLYSGLADPYLKTERARQHLDALREEVQLFSQSRPNRFRVERDVKNQRYRIHFTLKGAPDQIPLIVGDFLCCLRSSLDHLVWSLAKLRKPYPRGTEFPILEKPDGKKLRSSTRGVPAEAQDLIEALQPYHQGERAVRSHYLWQLNKLCNIDKHRRIPVHSQAVQANFPDLPKRFWHLVELDDAGMVSAPLSLESKMTLDRDSCFNMVFGDSFEGVECDIEGLARMHEFVANDVIPRFARFFK